MNTDKIIVFTDGGCLNNGKTNSIGSISIFFSDDDSKNYNEVFSSENYDNKITNQTMELKSCIKTFEILNESFDYSKNINIIYIYTDSMYVINCITKWYNKWIIDNWKTSNGKDVENKELIQLLYTLKSKYFVIFKHVDAHTNAPDIKDKNYSIWYGNYMADKLASDAITNYLNENKDNLPIETVVNKKKTSKIIKNLLNI